MYTNDVTSTMVSLIVILNNSVSRGLSEFRKFIWGKISQPVNVRSTVCLYPPQSRPPKRDENLLKSSHANSQEQEI